jgi:hypothetical protein
MISPGENIIIIVFIELAVLLLRIKNDDDDEEVDGRYIVRNIFAPMVMNDRATSIAVMGRMVRKRASLVLWKDDMSPLLTTYKNLKITGFFLDMYWQLIMTGRKVRR